MNEDDNTFHIAIKNGDYKTAQTLLENGADANDKLPLQIATQNGHDEIAKEIKKYNQNPDKYILENNDSPEESLKAIIRFEGYKKDYFTASINAALEWVNMPEYKLGYYPQVKECLEAQPAGVENGSFYTETSGADNL
jgi:ankyrin repeat protein